MIPLAKTGAPWTTAAHGARVLERYGLADIVERGVVAARRALTRNGTATSSPRARSGGSISAKRRASGAMLLTYAFTGTPASSKPLKRQG